MNFHLPKTFSTALLPPRPAEWPGRELLELVRQCRLRGHGLQTLWTGGKRPTGLQISGLEIADFRPYSQGDDVRFIDQSALARLDQLVIRLFHDRRALPVTILLDTSQSMNFGQPDKFSMARDLALVAGIMALEHHDSLRMVLTCDNTRESAIYTRNFNRPQAATDLIQLLRKASPTGRGNIAHIIEQCAAQAPARGLFVIISDFLPPGDISVSLRQLAAGKQCVTCLHILSPQEIHPGSAPGPELLDMETQTIRGIATDAGAVERYHQNMIKWLKNTEKQMRSHGAQWLLCDTSQTASKLLRMWGKQLGLVHT